MAKTFGLIDAEEVMRIGEMNRKHAHQDEREKRRERVRERRQTQTLLTLNMHAVKRANHFLGLG